MTSIGCLVQDLLTKLCQLYDLLFPTVVDCEGEPAINVNVCNPADPVDNTALIEAINNLCTKMETLIEQDMDTEMLEKLCDIRGLLMCTEEGVILENEGTELLVGGDFTGETEIDIEDEDGNVIGTSQITNVAYNPITNESTLTLATAATAQAVKVKKTSVALVEGRIESATGNTLVVSGDFSDAENVELLDATDAVLLASAVTSKSFNAEANNTKMTLAVEAIPEEAVKVNRSAGRVEAANKKA